MDNGAGDTPKIPYEKAFKTGGKRLDLTTANNNFQINWIEKLLITGIPDGRKETLRLILGPYLIKKKKPWRINIHIK